MISMSPIVSPRATSGSMRRLDVAARDKELRLGRVGLGIGHPDLHGLLLLEHVPRERVLRQRIDGPAADGDLVLPVQVLHEHHHGIVVALVRGDLGCRRAEKLGGALRELPQDLVQVQGRREPVR